LQEIYLKKEVDDPSEGQEKCNIGSFVNKNFPNIFECNVFNLFLVLLFTVMRAKETDKKIDP